MRIAVGGYLVSANTFATQRISLERFQRSVISGDDLLTRLGRGDSAIAGFLSGARECNWEVAPLHFMFPGLAGKVHGQAHQWAKETFVNTLRKTGPLDGVFLQLHGTAVADHVDDCEGDLLGAIRAVVGEKVPIIAALDGHANVTPLMVRQATMLIGVKTNPHYDYVPVGRKAAQMMAGMLGGSLTPVSAWAQPAMAPALQKLYIAPGWPMDHLMRLARNRAAADSRILDVSLLGGFFVSERPETGISVVVTANREQGLAVEIAEQIKDACWARRHEFHADMVSVPDAVREAIATDEGPVVLGDLADSGGAGTPGDGTAILAELLKQNARGAVIGNIADPDAVQEAIGAGVGKQVRLTVGGKVDRFHGPPVAISGRVRVIHDGTFTASTPFNAGTYHRGTTVVVDCGGTEVILTARPTLVFEANHFRSLGIEPTQRKILVCKAELQHRAGMAGVGRTFIDVDAPGLATQVLSRLPFSKIRRPIFPLDDI
ncbi:MAG TPA: M81 family metallopeptidase [Candidatus Binataceae bacterium]|jgi:microcystin degradation protein MlrC|nr:M81 family metallopeptidase [Candidatus Binataceae bacterium]